MTVRRGARIRHRGQLQAPGNRRRRLFAEPTRTAIMAIALHQSITSLVAWPVKAPLTDEEVMTYVDDEVYRVLLTLMLAESGGWNLFDPEKLHAMYD